MGGELGGGRHHPRHEQRHDHRAQRGGCGGEPLLGTAGARRAKHGGYMPVRQTSLDHEGFIDRGYGDTAAQQDLQALDHLGGQRREVGQGALLDLVAVTIGLAQQDCGWRVGAGDMFDVHEHE